MLSCWILKVLRREGEEPLCFLRLKEKDSTPSEETWGAGDLRSFEKSAPLCSPEQHLELTLCREAELICAQETDHVSPTRWESIAPCPSLKRDRGPLWRERVG